MRLSARFWASVENCALGRCLSVGTASVLLELASASFVVKTLCVCDSIRAATKFGYQTVSATAGQVLVQSSSFTIGAASVLGQFAREGGSIAAGIMRSERNGLSIFATTIEGSSTTWLSTSFKVGPPRKRNSIQTAAVLRLVTGTENELRASFLVLSLSWRHPIRAAAKLGLRAMLSDVSNRLISSFQYFLDRWSDRGGAWNLYELFGLLVLDLAFLLFRCGGNFFAAAFFWLNIFQTSFFISAGGLCVVVSAASEFRF